MATFDHTKCTCSNERLSDCEYCEIFNALLCIDDVSFLTNRLLEEGSIDTLEALEMTNIAVP